MNKLIFATFIIVFGYYLVRAFGKLWSRLKDDTEGNPINPEQIEKRKKNLEKILTVASTQNHITNNNVQKALGVSDATAARYLDYLVNLNKLSKVSERGKDVYFQLPNK